MPSNPSGHHPPANDASVRIGRPRDASVSTTVLRVTLELLAQEGYTGTRVDDVAQRAGVAKTTIYRRWPSKAALVIAAVRDAYGGYPISPQTSRDDLRAGVRRTASLMADPAINAGLTGLYAAAARDPEIRELFDEQMRRPYVAQITAALDTTSQVAELILDIVNGAALQHLRRGGPPSPEATELFIELLVGGLEPFLAATATRRAGDRTGH